MVKYYKTFRKRFEWKYQAQDFVKELKEKAKKSKLKIKASIEPEIRSISSRRADESRITAYWVKWFYKP